jgi:hypothetical protein
MRISDTGNVGIGTTAPSSKLDVVAAAFTGGPLIGARYNTANFRMGIGIANLNGFPFVGVNVNNAADDNGTFDINGRAARLRMSAGTFQFETSSASGTAGNAITWNTSAYLDASGNLGIGTTAPGARLSLSSFSDGVFATIGYGGGSYAGIGGTLSNGGGNTTGTLQFYTRTATGDASLSEKMRLNSNGNVGIGSTGYGNKLDVYLTNTQVALFGGGIGTGNGNYAGIALGYSEPGPIYQKSAIVQAQTGDGSARGTIHILNNNTASTDNAALADARLSITAAGDVGIGTTTPGYKLEVNGSFAATTKSFVIDHPTKPDMKLRYGSLEGPENGVYIRGKLNGKNIIELPDYWTGLVDEDTITVNLTPIGRKQDLFVKDISNNQINIGGTNVYCFYTVFAERKDVEKLIVELNNGN